MSPTREAGSAPAPSAPVAALGRVLLPLALLAAAVVAAVLAGTGVMSAGMGALALGLAVAGAAVAGACWGRQRQQARLREAREHIQLLGQLLPCWKWQTDAEHRLLRFQPPQAAAASAWAQQSGAGQWVWERFSDADGSLRAQLQAGAAIHGLAVQERDAEGATMRTWKLSALPHLDSQGRFAGHLGVAEPVPGTPASAAVRAEARAETVVAAAERQRAPQPSAAAPIANLAPSPMSPMSLPSDALAAEYAAFAYTLSHDLRAPIRVIEGFGRILKEDYGPQLDRIGRDHLERMVGAAARMNHMIDALLSLSQLSTQALKRLPVNLSQLAEWVVEELQRHQPERRVAIHIAPQLSAVGDPTLLRMALENLIGNAWKYSAKNPGAEIRFEQLERQGQRVFVVADNGAGFDMRFADRLFGVFQRLHSASDFQGTGVGLASVRRIIRRHGGEVWAEAEVGRGARFYFTLGTPIGPG